MSYSLPTANPLADQFLSPLHSALTQSSGSSRVCPSISDASFVESGLYRVLNSTDSGRDHLQRISATPGTLIKRSAYFEALKSKRRRVHMREIAQCITQKMASVVPDLIAQKLPMLDNFEVFAGDGHWHQHAAHDSANSFSGNKYATGHLYSLNLRTQALAHITAADQTQRRKEHDMRGLKRQTIDQLRQGAPRGKKVIWLWDPAGINLQEWWRWKQAGGIYFITPTKKNMLIEEGRAPAEFDRDAEVNAGVVADSLWGGSSQGVSMRVVDYEDPLTGKAYQFLTSLTDFNIPPGVIAHLYRMRWDIEKVFDEVKNKLHETKAWASSETAKSIQANLICITHNLLRMFENLLETEYGIINEAEHQRKNRRLATDQKKAEKAGRTLPVLIERLQRYTQVSVKFIRWLRYSVFGQTSQAAALSEIRSLYAHL